MVFLTNSPVEDTVGGEADKSLRLPCEMRSRRLDLEQKSSFMMDTNYDSSIDNIGQKYYHIMELN